jgi:hypothetical protein
LPTGPTCQPRCTAFLHPTTLPCSPARLHLERVLLPPTVLLGAIPTLRSALSTAASGALSLLFSFLHVAPSRPPISLSCSPPRAHRFGEATGASLHSVPRAHLSSSSPPSPPPTRPPRRLPPPETPPPLWFPPEHHRRPPLSVSTTARSLSIQMDSPLTFSLLPRHCRATPSMSSITGAASPPEASSPPPRRAAARVSSAPHRLARRAPRPPGSIGADAAATPSPPARSRRPHHRAFPERSRAR